MHSPASQAHPVLPPPTAFPDAGTYDVTQMVTLLSAVPGAAIHYTLDGSRPGPLSPVFDPYRLIVTADAEGQSGRSEHHLRAVAISPDGQASAVADFRYQIERRQPDEYISYVPAPGVRTICDFDRDKMYLIMGRDRALLIDAGMGSGDLRGYVETFTQGLPLTVVITHGHPDHIARLGQFQADCPVYMHAADLPLVNLSIKEFQYEIDPGAIRDVREGFVFDLGDRQLRVFEVPGHSAGSVVLLDEHTGDLFSGDAVGNNRPTIVDMLWMQRNPEGLDRYLSTLQVFRAKTAGNVKAIYNGHNDQPLNGDAYLDHLEEAVQRLVDQGPEALTPSWRPAGVWQTVSGDRLRDPDWAGINVNRATCLSAAPDQLASLSLLQLSGAALTERFSPDLLAYTARVDPAGSLVTICATATSTRCQTLRINGAAVKSGQPHGVQLTGETTPVQIDVVSPGGIEKQAYTVALTTV